MINATIVKMAGAGIGFCEGYGSFDASTVDLSGNPDRVVNVEGNKVTALNLRAIAESSRKPMEPINDVAVTMVSSQG